MTGQQTRTMKSPRLWKRLLSVFLTLALAVTLTPWVAPVQQAEAEYVPPTTVSNTYYRVVTGEVSITAEVHWSYTARWRLSDDGNTDTFRARVSSSYSQYSYALSANSFAYYDSSGNAISDPGFSSGWLGATNGFTFNYSNNFSPITIVDGDFAHGSVDPTIYNQQVVIPEHAVDMSLDYAGVSLGSINLPAWHQDFWSPQRTVNVNFAMPCPPAGEEYNYPYVPYQAPNWYQPYESGYSIGTSVHAGDSASRTRTWLEFITLNDSNPNPPAPPVITATNLTIPTSSRCRDHQHLLAQLL
jgi:hypothetical protein